MSTYPRYTYSTSTPVIVQEEKFPSFWFVLTAILGIALIIVFILYIRQGVVLIDPNDCPQVTGSYGVLPGTTGQPLRNCGVGGNQPCTSIEDTLQDAINTCNNRSDICKWFSYDCPSGTMSILDTTQELIPSSGTDTYLRQIDFIDTQTLIVDNNVS